MTQRHEMHARLRVIEQRLEEIGQPPWTGSPDAQDKSAEEYVKLHEEQARVEAWLRVWDANRD